eukprot:g7997.t1
MARHALLVGLVMAGRADKYVGSELHWLPTPDTLKSVRGLNRFIRAQIPGHTEPGIANVDGMRGMPLTQTKKRHDMRFLKFDSHRAVSIEAFKEAVLRKEPDLLNAAKRPGLVGLDQSETITSRSDRYNVFFWEEPWVGDYFWLIKRAFHRYIEEYGLSARIESPLFIHSWTNCLRTGQKLEWHNHCEPGDWQTSGTFIASAANGSATFFRVPGGNKIMKNPNTPHDIVMFDSLIEHQTSTVDDAQRTAMREQLHSDCRITSSWDINTHPGDIWQSVPFYDPHDPFFARDPTGERAVREGRRRIAEDRLIDEKEQLEQDPTSTTTRWGPIHAETRAKLLRELGQERGETDGGDSEGDERDDEIEDLDGNRVDADADADTGAEDPDQALIDALDAEMRDDASRDEL